MQQMKLPKIVVQPRKLTELLYEMQNGNLQVPRFQREFVWGLTKIRNLLDSIYKEFPIGTFFLWRAPLGSPSLSRPLVELGIPAPQDGAQVSYILDGQQRLTSLYVVMQGASLGSRDYGRVSIDLETATRYDQNKDEGFKENIFVYRLSDNRRYVAVKDLVSPQGLMIFKGIPDVWQAAYNKAYNLFQTYPFSVVQIQEQELGDAIEIFQRINQAGKRLGRYDLVCANIWAKDFNFRHLIAGVNQQFVQQGFGHIEETIFTQTFSLIIKDRCTTPAELALETKEVAREWNRVISALRQAVDFAVSNLGVKRADYLPYRGILPVLAYHFYHAQSGALTALERETLWNWFWRVTLSERYASTSPSRMAEDARKLKAMHEGAKPEFDYPSRVNAEAVKRTRMTQTSSALRNAVICMLALMFPRNLKDGSPVNLANEHFSNLSRVDRHHIFPIGYLKVQGHISTLVHRVPNFCFIPADLNKEIGSRAPAEYLSLYRQTNPHFTESAESHLLPVSPQACVWKNDFEGFLTERAALIADQLNRLIGSKPDDFGVPETDNGSSISLNKVDALEIRIRDFIDDRLTVVLGSHYWNRAMPGDVIQAVKDLIQAKVKSHPYLDRSEFASGRKRLDFCDVSHYDKIILKNWAQFEEYFQSKDRLQGHMTAYRELRNCVQHNRTPTDVELKNGEAAMLWLEHILDQYEEEAMVSDESEEVEAE